jgi:site-specific DNA recombinase
MRRIRDNITGATTVLYARKSTADPKNPGKSTSDQLDTQRQRAAHLGLKIVAEFTDDGIGASRHSRGKVRPGFVAAVDYLRQHPIEVFSTWELSRATRRLRVYSDLMELCEDRGTYLLVGDRIYDPLDPTDQMVLGMTAVQDSAEVARLRERVLRGVASTAAQGRPHGRNVYGYERIYDQRTRALIEVREHPEQGPVIREMVQRTLAGVSANQIIRDLNARGITHTSGARFNPPDVTEMLSKPTYRGMRSHHGTLIPAIWPALIQPDEWVALNRILSNRNRGIHKTTAKHLLTGVAMCARCERAMYVDIKKGKITQGHYHCGVCSRSRNARHLETWVRREIDVMLTHPRLRKALSAVRDDSQELKLLDQLRAELDDAYSLGLSPRGLVTVEQRLLPQIEQIERDLLADNEPNLTGIIRLPDDVTQARTLLRGLVRVWVGRSRRGRGFDESTVLLRPARSGPPSDKE